MLGGVAGCGTLASSGESIGAGAYVCKGSTEFDLESFGFFVQSVEHLIGTGQDMFGYVHLEVRRRAWIWECTVVVV